MRNTIFRGSDEGSDEGFNYNHTALNEDGSIHLYIDVKTEVTDYNDNSWIVYKLTSAYYPELLVFYRSVIMEYVTQYNESDDYYFSNRPNRNYRLSLGHLWSPNHGIIRFFLKIIYILPTDRATEVRSVLTPHVARQLVRGLPTEGVCPITYEPYIQLPQLYVGFCGHVFSPAVISQTTCPLCRYHTGWTPVKQEALID